MTDSKRGVGLQVYVEVPDLVAGQAAARRLIELVAPHATVLSHEVEPYWKIEAYHGVWLRMAAENPVAAHAALLSALAADWDRHDDPVDPWAVWNHDRNGPCPLPSARWMSLDLIPLEPE